MEHIEQALSRLQQEGKIQPESILKVLEAYNHIELTEEEHAEGTLWAKRKKEAQMEENRVKEIEARNRRLLSGSQWSFAQTESYMEYRATQIFDKPYVLDSTNKVFHTLLCFYFSNDPGFIPLATSMGIENPSLSKGLFLAGSIGVGKTVMMKLFSKNQRQVFAVKTAKSIAESFQTDGEGSLQQLLVCPPLPVNDASNFYHSKLGLCIDDIGTEEFKKHFGNGKNVIGDLIELRYANGNYGPLLHLTTNLTAQQLREFYGDRVGSRIREMMNIIKIVGKDRRI